MAVSYQSSRAFCRRRFRNEFRIRSFASAKLSVRAGWMSCTLIRRMPSRVSTAELANSGSPVASVKVVHYARFPDDRGYFTETFRREQIADAMNGVICRCGTYQRIEQAIKSVAGGEA